MRYWIKLFILLLMVMTACTNGFKKPGATDFYGQAGVLYFSYPTAGQMINGFFLPYGDQSHPDDDNLSAGIHIEIGGAGNWETLGKGTKIPLKSANNSGTIMYIIDNVKIYYSLSKIFRNEADEIFDGLKVDTLYYSNKIRAVYYYDSYIRPNIKIGK